MSQGFDRAMVWLGTVSNLGRMWLYSRQPHIEEDLPETFADGEWVAIATHRAVQPGEPVYGTPCYKPVRPGARFWIFCEPGEYFVYAVRGSDTQAALKAFYADPDEAKLVSGGLVSEPGFRARL